MVRRKRNPNGTWSFEVLYGRVAVVVAVLLLILWLAKSIFIFCFFKYYRDYENLNFWDALIYPVNMSEVRVRQGNADIEEAKKLISERKWSEAYMSLAKGVGRSPKNVEGRQMLAEFDLAIRRRPDIAIDTLERGILYGKDDLKFMRLYLRLLIDQSADKKLIKVATTLLERNEVKNEEVIAYLSVAASTVYALHGNYELSKEILVKHGIDRSLPGVIRLSRNEWEQGNSKEAIKIILENLKYSTKRAPLYALLANYYAALKDYDTAMKYSTLRAVEDPFSVDQRVERFELLYKAGRGAEIKQGVNDFIEQYGSNHKAMLLLGNFAAESGNIELMRRVYDIAIQRNFSIAPYCLLLMETMIGNGMYKESVAFAENIMQESPAWVKRYEDVFSCLRAVSYYALGNVNMTDILLGDILKRSMVTPKILVATARRLDLLGGTVHSHKLLESAVDRYPNHQLALTRLVQMEIKVGNSTNLDKHILKLLQMRRPPRTLIDSAKKNLVSDRFIFASDRSKILSDIDVLISNRDTEKSFSDREDEEVVERITDGGERGDF